MSRFSYIHLYLKLSRLHLFPLGSILVFFPCVLGYFLALSGSNTVHNVVALHEVSLTVLAFGVGATLLHSVSCVLSDICDREFDAQVARTKTRPLASGQVSLLQASIFACSLTIPLFMMLNFTNDHVKMSFICGQLPLCLLYPLTKRWTWWPQFWLGLAINFGIFPAWYVAAPHRASMSPATIVIFVGLICWSIVYDTIYACQDRKDDIKVGVKSTALLFGNHVRQILYIFLSGFVSCLVLAGVLNGNGVTYFVVSCGGSAFYIFRQLVLWDDHDDDDCASKFKAIGNAGYIACAGVLLESMKRGHALLW